METIKGVVDGASRVLFGDQATQQQRSGDSNLEPQSGVTGNTGAGEPYDGGNFDENTNRNTSGTVKVPGYSATDDAHAFETHHELPRDDTFSGSRNTTTNAGSGLTGSSSNTYGSSNVEHGSQVVNVLDPRVDSDRTAGHDGNSNTFTTGGSLIEGVTGQGHHQTRGSGLGGVGGQSDESARGNIHDTSVTGLSGSGPTGGQGNNYKQDTASSDTSGLTPSHARDERVPGNTGGHGSSLTESASREGMGNTSQMEDYGAGQAHGRANEPTDILGGPLGGGSHSKRAPSTEDQHSSVSSHGKHQGADAPLSGPDSRHESHAIRDTKNEAERKLNPRNDDNNLNEGVSEPTDKGRQGSLTGHLPGAPGGEGLQKVSQGEGTGTQYVKSTGLAAEGGDFDASRPGAGKEADRLLEEKGIHHGEDKPNASTSGTEGTSKMAGGHAGGHSVTGHTGHSGAGEASSLGGQTHTTDEHRGADAGDNSTTAGSSGAHTGTSGRHDNSKTAGHHSSTTHAAEHGDDHEKLSLKDKIKAKLHKN